jgi:hypothetical protein
MRVYEGLQGSARVAAKIGEDPRGSTRVQGVREGREA